MNKEICNVATDTINHAIKIKNFYFLCIFALILLISPNSAYCISNSYNENNTSNEFGYEQINNSINGAEYKINNNDAYYLSADFNYFFIRPYIRNSNAIVDSNGSIANIKDKNNKQQQLTANTMSGSQKLYGPGFTASVGVRALDFLRTDIAFGYYNTRGKNNIIPLKLQFNSVDNSSIEADFSNSNLSYKFHSYQFLLNNSILFFSEQILNPFIMIGLGVGNGTFALKPSDNSQFIPKMSRISFPTSDLEGANSASSIRSSSKNLKLNYQNLNTMSNNQTYFAAVGRVGLELNLTNSFNVYVSYEITNVPKIEFQYIVENNDIANLSIDDKSYYGLVGLRKSASCAQSLICGMRYSF